MRSKTWKLGMMGVAWLCWAGASLLSGVEPQPLWPPGATPYENPADEQTGYPKVFAYPVEEERRNGAAVVITPGGGYGGLAADHEGHQVARWMNERGVSAFVLHYRLGTQGNHFPTQLADVQRTMRRVRAEADHFGIDPARVGVMGFSAGGHLASMAATLFDRKAYEPVDEVDEMSARPDFAVLCYPVISMEKGVTHGGSRKNLLGPGAEDDEAAREVSSDLNVTAQTPPTFLFQTDEDTAVPAENAVRFYLALRKHGVASEMHIYQRGPHGVGLFLGDPVLGTWTGHLDHWLRDNGFYAGRTKRVAVQGSVTLDGVPVSWGSVTFRPEDAKLPVTTVRVRRGKFQADAGAGPVEGPAVLTFSGSIWEETGEAADGLVELDRLRPEGEELIEVELKEGMAEFAFAFRSR